MKGPFSVNVISISGWPSSCISVPKREKDLERQQIVITTIEKQRESPMKTGLKLDHKSLKVIYSLLDWLLHPTNTTICNKYSTFRMPSQLIDSTQVYVACLGT